MILRPIRSLAMKSVFAALSAGIVLAAVSAVASAEEPADPQAGFEYAQTYCATCHGNSEEKSP
jgi:mono/diheme cytochrome c family protein